MSKHPWQAQADATNQPSTTQLKLYVWEDVFSAYWPGMAVAIAPDIRTARRIVAEKYGINTEQTIRNLTTVKPTVVRINEKTKPQAWQVSGGD
jgi:hypothetical protein